MRTFTAFISAPLFVALGWSTYAFFGDRSLTDKVLEFLVSTTVWFIYAAIFTAVFAIPLFLIFRRLNFINIWTSALSGIFVSSVALIVLRSHEIFEILWLCTLGGIAGVIFWLVGRFKVN